MTGTKTSANSDSMSCSAVNSEISIPGADIRTCTGLGSCVGVPAERFLDQVDLFLSQGTAKTGPDCSCRQIKQRSANNHVKTAILVLGSVRTIAEENQRKNIGIVPGNYRHPRD